MLKNLLAALMTKKKLVGIISAILIAIIAAVLGEPVESLKETICSEPSISLPAGPVEIPVEPAKK